jgi:nucleotide-binding universal stress UspA family protein
MTAGPTTPRTRPAGDLIGRMPIEHVTLATDSGPSGITALRWLADRWTRRALDVEIVIVVDPADGLGAEQDAPQRTADRAAEDAERLLRRLAPGITVGTSVLEGDPIRTLRHASRFADLLVVGSDREPHGGHHVTSAFATRLASGAFCPTIVVPRGWEPSPGPVVVGASEDGSEEDALRFAGREAEALGRDLLLVHAGRGDADRDPHAPAAAARQRLDVVAARLRMGHPDLRVTPVLDDDRPARSLERAGRSAALVVVGSRGLDAVDRLLTRSVSRAVLDRLACPVAIVPQGG